MKRISTNSLNCLVSNLFYDFLFRSSTARVLENSIYDKLVNSRECVHHCLTSGNRYQRILCTDVQTVFLECLSIFTKLSGVVPSHIWNMNIIVLACNLTPNYQQAQCYQKISPALKNSFPFPLSTNSSPIAFLLPETSHTIKIYIWYLKAYSYHISILFYLNIWSNRRKINISSQIQHVRTYFDATGWRKLLTCDGMDSKSVVNGVQQDLD